jgi:succinate-semialdehyde dehydrogenase / glutarate-semialdehyde dehydrogenase
MTAYPDLKLFIGGEWKSADGLPVLNPADESVIGVVPHATRADLDAALTAAEVVFKCGAARLLRSAEIILKAARLVRERR